MSIEQQTQASVLREFVEQSMEDLGVSMPGIIYSYNRAKQTARIIPALTRRVRSYTDDSIFFESLPHLYNVPVVWPGGGSSYFHGELSPGENVLLIVSDADFTKWRRSGRQEDPIEEGSHSYDSAYAIPGLRANPARLPNTPVVVAAHGQSQSAALAEPLLTVLNALVTALNANSAASTITGTQLAGVGEALSDALGLNVFASQYIKAGG